MGFVYVCALWAPRRHKVSPLFLPVSLDHVDNTWRTAKQFFLAAWFFFQYLDIYTTFQYSLEEKNSRPHIFGCTHNHHPSPLFTMLFFFWCPSRYPWPNRRCCNFKTETDRAPFDCPLLPFKGLQDQNNKLNLNKLSQRGNVSFSSEGIDKNNTISTSS